MDRFEYIFLNSITVKTNLIWKTQHETILA